MTWGGEERGGGGVVQDYTSSILKNEIENWELENPHNKAKQLENGNLEIGKHMNENWKPKMQMGNMILEIEIRKWELQIENETWIWKIKAGIRKTMAPQAEIFPVSSRININLICDLTVGQQIDYLTGFVLTGFVLWPGGQI